MNIPDLRKSFASELKIPVDDVQMEFDTEFPECLLILVLQDLGPAVMGPAVRDLKTKNVERAVLNVVEKKKTGKIRELLKSGFKPAFEESWNISVATLRLG